MDSSQFARHVAIAVVVVAAAGLAAGAPPPAPAAYYGEVTMNGDPLPAGTTIVATVDGETRGTITLEEAGRYGGAGGFDDKLEVTGSEADDGKAVRFSVGDVQASETVAWHSEDVREVRLTFTDDEPPTARTGLDREADMGQPVEFDGRESSDNGAIAAYEWAFGDGTTATGATPAHRYDTAGTYDVTLTVRDAAGRTDTDTVRLTVSDRSTGGGSDGGQQGSGSGGGDGADQSPTGTAGDSPTPTATPSPMPDQPSPTPGPTATVTATPVPDQPSPTPSATVTPTPSTTTTGTAPSTPTQSPTTGSGPGFGILSVLAAVGAILAFRRRR